MEQVLVVYWSGTGNTEQMAQAVADGATSSGADVQLKEAGDIRAEHADKYTRIAFGCPSMGGEELEDIVMEPFFAEVEKKLTGKKVALFGSYGWGDGQWMRDWEERVRSAGAVLCGDAGVICNEAPDQDAITACNQLGNTLATMQ